MTITKTNTSYQYLRLNDGKELFAMVKEVDDQLELHFPMNILCKPAMTGGVTIHLGPFVPFTTDDSMIIDSSEVVVRTSITDQFIDLYDQSITTWLDMRDNDHIQIKTKKQDQLYFILLLAGSASQAGVALREKSRVELRDFSRMSSSAALRESPSARHHRGRARALCHCC